MEEQEGCMMTLQVRWVARMESRWN